MREGFRSKQWSPPPDPKGSVPVRPLYLAWNDKLKIARLPLRYFANGHTFFVQRIYAKSEHPPPFAVHMTYQYGDSSKFPYGKRQRMREGRVWQVDPPSYYGEGRYLAVAPEAAALPIDYLSRECTTADAADRFNKEDAHLRVVLRDALALAIALNRTLVLPRMLCYCDNIWKEMKHCRVGGAFGMTLPFDCPADHIMNLASWCAPRRPPPNPARAPLNPSLPFARFDTDVPIGFREPGFLTDPRLSPAIVSSWVRLEVPPMTADEAVAKLATHAGTAVLELSAVSDRFCGFEDRRASPTPSVAASGSLPRQHPFAVSSSPRAAAQESRAALRSNRAAARAIPPPLLLRGRLQGGPGWHSVLLAVLPWRSWPAFSLQVSRGAARISRRCEEAACFLCGPQGSRGARFDKSPARRLSRCEPTSEEPVVSTLDRCVLKSGSVYVLYHAKCATSHFGLRAAESSGCGGLQASQVSLWARLRRTSRCEAPARRMARGAALAA